MMALDQALAELEIPQPDPGRWAGQLAETSLELIQSVQHLWFIVAASALFLPLGLVILGSAVLPRILGYLALVLAAGYALAGVLTLLDLTVPPAVQHSASIPLWWLAAAGTLIMRARHAPSAAGLPGGVAAAGARNGGTLAMKGACGSLAERYASRTIQVADGQIASGVDAGARR